MKSKKYFTLCLLMVPCLLVNAEQPNANTPAAEQFPSLSAANEQQRADQIDALLNANSPPSGNAASPFGLTQEVTVSGQLNVDGEVSSGKNSG